MPDDPPEALPTYVPDAAPQGSGESAGASVPEEPLVALTPETAPDLQATISTAERNLPVAQGGPARSKRPTGGAAPSAEEISRALPSSVDAEKGVLSAMLQSPDELVGEAVESLSPEAFYVPAHRTLYELLLKLGDAGQPIDAITLQEALMREKLMEKVGGPAAVHEIIDFVPDSSHFTYYVELVKEKHVLRDIISTCSDCIQSAYEHEGEAQEILDRVEQTILDIGDRNDREEGGGSMRDHVMKAVEAIEDMYENKGKVQGIPTGFRDIDAAINGMREGQMLVIAARPGMGKTSFAMNIAEHVAVDQGIPVAIFSLEMTTNELVQRLLCSRARVDSKKIRAGMPEKRDFPKLMQAAGELGNAKMVIDETPGISIMELRAKARRMKQKDDIQLVIIDYLQLMKSTSRRAQDNRQIEIAEISAGLKGLAKELKVPVIVLAQVNRNPEDRKGGRPRVSDLRESGAIEQDADLVGMLMRPELYADEDDEREEKEGEATFIIAKQRSGPICDVPLTFIGSQVRFADRAHEDEH